MKSVLFIFFVLLAISSESFSKPWKDAKPGKTTREQIVKIFGAPTQEFSKGGKLSNGLNYQGKQSIEGSTQANFFFDKNDVLFRIDVFPSRVINRDQITQVFGKKFKERKTPKGHVFFEYSKAGLIVFFDRDKDQVVTFTFFAEQFSSEQKKTISIQSERNE